MNYYSHHIGDYASHTSHLSLLEHGVYRRMIDIYYLSESAFSTDIAAVCRKVGAKTEEEKLAVDTILNEFFILTDEGFRQKRCDAEIEMFKTKAVKASESAQRRWTKGESMRTQCDRNANAMPTHSERNANAMPTQCDDSEGRITVAMLTNNQEPITNNHKPVKAVGALATRLPADWSPSDEDIEFCRQHRPDLRPSEVAAQFRDYWIAQGGAKGRKADWPATWRNWVRNQRAQARASPAGYESAKDRSRREAIENLTGYKNGSYDIFDAEANPFLLGQ